MSGSRPGLEQVKDRKSVFSTVDRKINVKDISVP